MKLPSLEQITSVSQKLYKIGLPFLMLVGVLFVISDVFSHRLYVGNYSIPEFDYAKGINGSEAGKMINDDIEMIYKKASSMKSKHSDVRDRVNPFDIDVSGVKSSYNAMVDYIKGKLNIEDNVISGALYYEGAKFCYRTRINSQLIDTRCFDFSNDSNMTQLKMVDSIIFEQAHGIVGYTDPYILCMYHYKKGQYHKSLDGAFLSLEKEPDARMYALGTIANCYRELKDFENAENYYLKSIKEFPDFYPSKWQYAILLMESNKLDEARHMLKEVIDGDNKMIKQCLLTGMKIECRAGDSEQFNLQLDEYLKMGQRETLMEDPELSDCLKKMKN